MELVRPLVSVHPLVLLLPDMYRLLDPYVHSVAFSVDDFGLIPIYDVVEGDSQSPYTRNWERKFEVKRSKVKVTGSKNVKIVFRAYPCQKWTDLHQTKIKHISPAKCELWEGDTPLPAPHPFSARTSRAILVPLRSLYGYTSLGRLSVPKGPEIRCQSIGGGSPPLPRSPNPSSSCPSDDFVQTCFIRANDGLYLYYTLLSQLPSNA